MNFNLVYYNLVHFLAALAPLEVTTLDDLFAGQTITTIGWN